MDDRQLPADFRARLADPNLRFPRQPCLAPDLDVFTMPDGLGIQVRGGQTPVVLRGPIAEKLMAYLLPLLDGLHRVEELLDGSPPDVPTASVARALTLLHTKGLLVEGDMRPRVDQPAAASGAHLARDEPLRRQLLFWGRHLDLTRSARYADQIQRALEAAQIVVIASGLFGTAVCDLLARSGCRNLRVVDWDDEGLVAASVASGVLENVHLEIRSTPVVCNVLSAWMPTAELVVTATRNGSAELFRAINAFSLQHQRPWLRGNFDGSEFEFGPYVRPYGSSCFRCLELREASAMAGAIEERLYQDRLAEERPAGMQAPLGEGLVGAALGASILTAEVIRTVTDIAPPTLLDHVLRISPAGGTIETAHVRRVPRCPDCYEGSIAWPSAP